MIADATGKKSQDQNLYLMTEKSSYQVQNHVVFFGSLRKQMFF